MLEKVKAKAEEFLGRNDVQIIGGMIIIVAATGLMTYISGYCNGLVAGTEAADKTIVDFVEACGKLAKKAV